MIESPRALRIPVSDLDLGQWWYTQAFGIEPSEVRDDGVQFQVHGFAVLLTPGTPQRDAGPVLYWGVADVAREQARLLALQSDTTQALQARADATADTIVRDPFGNAFGLTTLGDMQIKRAREQRSSEKIALRHVRETLDGLQQEEQQKRHALRQLLRVAAVLLVVAILAALVARQLRAPKPAQTLPTPPVEVSK